MRTDGSGVRRLTSPTFDAQDPTFSPDGRQIALSHGGGAAFYRIYTMETDGRNLREVTPPGMNDGYNIGPDWGPRPRGRGRPPRGHPQHPAHPAHPAHPPHPVHGNPHGGR
jgi:hypothetical protein